MILAQYDFRFTTDTIYILVGLIQKQSLRVSKKRAYILTVVILLEFISYVYGIGNIIMNCLEKHYVSPLTTIFINISVQLRYVIPSSPRTASPTSFSL